MSGGWIAVIVCLWVTVLALVVVVAGLLRRVAVVLETQPLAAAAADSRSGPPIGDRLPPLSVVAPGGESVALSDVPGPFVLVVLTTTCEPCLRVAEWLREQPAPARSDRRLIVLTDAGGRERLGLDETLTVVTDDRAVAIAGLRLRGTPYVIEVDADRVVARSSVLGGTDRLSAILNTEESDRDRPIRVQLANG